MTDLILTLNEELEANRIEENEIRKIREPILKRSADNSADRKRIEKSLDDAHEAYRQMTKHE